MHRNKNGKIARSVSKLDSTLIINRPSTSCKVDTSVIRRIPSVRCSFSLAKNEDEITGEAKVAAMIENTAIFSNIFKPIP